MRGGGLRGGEGVAGGVTDSSRRHLDELPEDARDYYEERAGLCEYLAGMSRAKAEWGAYRLTCRKWDAEPRGAQLRMVG